MQHKKSLSIIKVPENMTFDSFGDRNGGNYNDDVFMEIENIFVMYGGG